MKKAVTTTTDRIISNNLEAWFDHASLYNRTDGLIWYEKAQSFCQQTAATYDIDSYTVAGVVSALSPNNKWSRNKVDAITVIEAWLSGKGPDDVKVCTYNANKQKAFRILEGESITESSPKTHSFAMNVGLNSPDHITIDKWHIRACLCKPADGVVDTVEGVTPKQYRRIEAITARIAHKHNLKGYEMQAIVWVTIKQAWGR